MTRSATTAAAKGQWTVTIPGYQPTTVNQLMRGVRSRINLKKRDRKWIGDYLGLVARVPQATAKRRVHLTIGLAKGQRAPDVDSSHKAILDALKFHGFIRNDSPKWVEISPIRFSRGEVNTVITLEDID